MRRPAIDRQSAERLLSAAVPGDDAPPGYAGAAELLQAASAPPTTPELAAEAGTVAAMAEALALTPRPAPHHTRRSTVLTKLLTAKAAAAAAVAGTLTLTGGLAAANALPAPAQHMAARALSQVGISVPGDDDHATGSDDTTAEAPENETPEAPEAPEVDAPETGDDNGGVTNTGDGTGVTTTTEAGEDSGHHGTGTDGKDNKGSEISNLAHSTDNSGPGKGAVVSNAASDGRSHAGEDHHATGTTTSTTTGAVNSTGDDSGHHGDDSGHHGGGDDSGQGGSGHSGSDG